MEQEARQSLLPLETTERGVLCVGFSNHLSQLKVHMVWVFLFLALFIDYFPVTAVGSTEFSQQIIGNERATTSFPSGGGFSWVFERPNYQAHAVSQYLSNTDILPTDHFWKPSGRAIPDVSALGIG